MFPIFRVVPRWFPGANFQRQAEEWKRLGADARNAPFQHVKKELVRGLLLTRAINDPETQFVRFLGERDGCAIRRSSFLVHFTGRRY